MLTLFLDGELFRGLAVAGQVLRTAVLVWQFRKVQSVFGVYLPIMDQLWAETDFGARARNGNTLAGRGSRCREAGGWGNGDGVEC